MVSGYVVTAMLLRNIGSTRNSIYFLDFYGKRFKRLLPNANMVFLFILIAGRYATVPSVYIDWVDSVKWSCAFSANYYFYDIHTDYFKESKENIPSPSMHFWSLAIEEQFYFLWPLLFSLLQVTLRFSARSSSIFLLALSFLSFSCTSSFSGTTSMFNFFLLPARAWELLLGCSISCLEENKACFSANLPLYRILAEVQGVVGLIAICTVTYFYDTDTSTIYPGKSLLIPTFATCLLLTTPATTRVSRILSWRPLVYIGDASYSLYLWHWPFITMALAKVELLQASVSTDRVKLWALMTSFPVAFFMYHFIEVPMRRRNFSVTVNLLLGAVLVFGTCLLSEYIQQSATLASHLTPVIDRNMSAFENLMPHRHTVVYKNSTLRKNGHYIPHACDANLYNTKLSIFEYSKRETNDRIPFDLIPSLQHLAKPEYPRGKLVNIVPPLLSHTKR